MTTIKAIEARSVHRIQSGQVIVDLCSVVKELVENSLDANGSIIEVRFKNNGLDSIEVQDNGTGIDPANYGSLALKHYTSKLSSYDDLSNVETFGFRGEALSSLCALSNFTVVTALAHEAPKGTRLEFEQSGALKSTSVIASQKGTTTYVESLFEQLPVRRRELTKNIKREYSKVVGLLNAYACISTNVKFIVKNTMPKGKTTVVFSTNSNLTTRENIANVYGARTLSALVSLDLELEMDASGTQLHGMGSATLIRVRGHISRPVFGEGRQAPDRQMFFVNGRPCGLPQVAKAINEVYRSYNFSQSPFVFADLQMDTNAYDVNVSPDKMTILLHNSAATIEKLKVGLTDLFDGQEQTVPQSQLPTQTLPAFRQLHVNGPASADCRDDSTDGQGKLSGIIAPEDGDLKQERERESAFHDHFKAFASTREEETETTVTVNPEQLQKRKEQEAARLAKKLSDMRDNAVDDEQSDEIESSPLLEPTESGDHFVSQTSKHIALFNQSMRNQGNTPSGSTGRPKSPVQAEAPDLDSEISQGAPNLVKKAFDNTRPLRARPDIVEITVGDDTVIKRVGVEPSRTQTSLHKFKNQGTPSHSQQRFSSSLQQFKAPGHDPAVSDLQSGETNGSREGSPPSSSSEAEDDHLTSNNQTVGNAALQSDASIETSDESESGSIYEDEDEKKATEEARVTALIVAAEQVASNSNMGSIKKANAMLKSAGSKHSTRQLLTTVNMDMVELDQQARNLNADVSARRPVTTAQHIALPSTQSEEQRLSLAVSKADFRSMQIVGQFNLGFILAVRPTAGTDGFSAASQRFNELFIIDQHASDEKFNFERLQQGTVVGNQRLVHPIVLELTAVEEEVVLENMEALERNGFIVETDTSGDAPVGLRIKLLSLPLSKEVTFDIRDLEELIHLLADSPISVFTPSTWVPRPTKVRKMFAMRACRSSIMIGKTLSKRQMSNVVTNMGTIDKPWNCPHGRPTMRHLSTLDTIDVWREGDGVVGMGLTPEMQEGVSSWAEYASIND